MIILRFPVKKTKYSIIHESTEIHFIYSIDWYFLPIDSCSIVERWFTSRYCNRHWKERKIMASSIFCCFLPFMVSDSIEESLRCLQEAIRNTDLSSFNKEDMNYSVILDNDIEKFIETVFLNSDSWKWWVMIICII